MSAFDWLGIFLGFVFVAFFAVGVWYSLTALIRTVSGVKPRLRRSAPRRRAL